MFSPSGLRPRAGCYVLCDRRDFSQSTHTYYCAPKSDEVHVFIHTKMKYGYQQLFFSKLSSCVICGVSEIRSSIIVLLLEERSWLQPWRAVNSDWERYQHSLVKIISKTINGTSAALSCSEWELYCLKIDIFRSQRFSFCSTVQSCVNPADLSLLVSPM